MNLWECEGKTADGKRCRSTAVGVGGAIGLRAIGWHFRRGGPLLCPAHRPDPVTDPAAMNPDWHRESERDKPCSLCKAEREADILQSQVTRWLCLPFGMGEIPPGGHATSNPEGT